MKRAWKRAAPSCSTDLYLAQIGHPTDQGIEAVRIPVAGEVKERSANELEDALRNSLDEKLQQVLRIVCLDLTWP